MTTPSPTPADWCDRCGVPAVDCKMVNHARMNREANTPAASAQDISGEAVRYRCEGGDVAMFSDGTRNGEWIRATDFDALRQRLTEAESRNAQLAAEMEGMRKALASIAEATQQAGFDCPHSGHRWMAREARKLSVAALAREQGGRKPLQPAERAALDKALWRSVEIVNDGERK